MYLRNVLLLLFTIVSYNGFLLAGNKTIQQPKSPDKIINKVVNHYFENHNQFSTRKDVRWSYTVDLTLEAMLFYDLYSGNHNYTRKVLQILELRDREPSDTIPYNSQPFCSYNYALLKATGDEDYVNPYITETIRMLKEKESKKTMEGAVQHLHQGSYYILIDFMQEYCSRVARTGLLTGDSAFYEECTAQFEIYRKILRNQETGLYSQGRGFLPDSIKLSPGAWSRGHGWLMRGIVTTMEALPPQSAYYNRIQKILKELADALLDVQDENGMWHQLLHLPFDKSYPESSGTGMIAYNMAVAYKKGFLKDVKYKSSALKAANELKKYVTEDGVVLGTCEGPGTNKSIEKYLNNPAKPDDHHGAQAIIYGMFAEIILTE